ncbi:MAG: ATP-binding protein [Ruminococcus sp.]|nr:ATP-binding protein [Ruminococcus sp.]
MANIREKLDNLYCGLRSLTVFRSLLNDDVISALSELLKLHADGKSFDTDIYSEFVSRLYRRTPDLSEYIFKIICKNENFYISGRAKGESFDETIERSVINELTLLNELARLSPEELQYGYYRHFPLAEWKNSEIDFIGEYKKRIENIGRYGYGHFAEAAMFILKNGETVPVKYPDTQRLSELYGYERERGEVVANTLALVNGKKAQNVLLYGDAGTGKSSTVKAVVNEFSDRGLRLVEITKEQLKDIPLLISKLNEAPLKFIIFIDDLTFNAGEDCFGALKAALEGSVSARAENTAIYATSNRRHLVKESFSDREGDDIHRNDTMQELLSLSARFGLRVNFSRPDKKDYTAIAAELAKAHDINMPFDELAMKAEQFAISSGNGRSPRTARQFINQLVMEM